MRLLILAFAAVCLTSMGARAQTATMNATLTPISGTPAAAANARGEASLTLDHATRELRWQVTYSGLSSDPAGAHIHTAGGPGVAPTIVVDIGRNGVSTSMVGSATLDATQMSDLLGGRLFIDVHTQLNQNGEISGAISP